MLKSLLETGLPLLWVSLWMLGGIWLTRSVFNLRRNEQVLVGISLGLILQTCLANILNRYLPAPFTDLISAGVVFGFGLFLILQQHHSLFKSLPLTLDWILIFGLAFLFFNIQHGLAIQDDLTYLSFSSRTAARDIFAYTINDPTPSLPLVLTAQLQRIAAIFPWNALNLIRSLSMALGILLAGAWTRRLTHSQTAGVVGSTTAAFGMGTTWLLLVFPGGSPLNSSGIFSPVSAVLPLPLPESFSNTFFQPLAFTYNPDILWGFIMLACLLLTFNRWRQPLVAALLSSILLASLLLAFGNTVFFILAWLALLIVWSIVHHSLRFTGKFWAEMGIFALAGGLVFGYRGAIISLIWPEVKLTSPDPVRALFFLIQIIPIICMCPLFIAWGIKAFKVNRWMELSIWLSALFSLFFILVEFSNRFNMDSRASPIPKFLWALFTLYAAGLAWNWAARRNQSLKILAASFGLLTILGGMFTFAISLTALPQNTLPPGLTSLDAQFYTDYWNRPDLLKGPILDTQPLRGETIFGHFINRSAALSASVLSPKLGFDYLYIDETGWNKMDLATQNLFNAPCVKTVKEYKSKRGDAFRRLLDVSGCR